MTALDALERSDLFKFPSASCSITEHFGYNRKVCPPPLRRREPYIRSVGVKSPTERQQAYGLPLLVESKAFNLGHRTLKYMNNV